MHYFIIYYMKVHHILLFGKRWHCLMHPILEEHLVNLYYFITFFLNNFLNSIFMVIHNSIDDVISGLGVCYRCVWVNSQSLYQFCFWHVSLLWTVLNFQDFMIKTSQCSTYSTSCGGKAKDSTLTACLEPISDICDF